MNPNPLPRPRGRPKKALAVPAQSLGPRVGLHEQVASRLRAMIVAGEIATGTVLVESDLSAALGVSRTPLREALKLLAAEGLVELRQNRSARVPDWTREQMLELFEAIAGIERLGAELAAGRITEAELAELRAMQAELDGHHAAGDLSRYFALNQAIHRFIVAAGRNRPLGEAHDLLSARAQWARLKALSVDDRWRESADEHRAILAALEARDAARAGDLAGRHVLRTGEIIARNLPAGEANS